MESENEPKKNQINIENNVLGQKKTGKCFFDYER